MPMDVLLDQLNPFYTNAEYSIEQARVNSKSGIVKPNTMSYLAWDASLTLSQRTYNLDPFIVPPPDHLTTQHPSDFHCACVRYAKPPDSYTPGEGSYHVWRQKKMVRNCMAWRRHIVHYTDFTNNVKVYGIWFSPHLFAFLSPAELKALTLDGMYRSAVRYEGPVTTNEMYGLRRGESPLLALAPSHLWEYLFASFRELFDPLIDAKGLVNQRQRKVAITMHQVCLLGGDELWEPRAIWEDPDAPSGSNASSQGA